VVEYEFLDTLETVIDNWDTLAPWFKDSVFDIISAGSRDLKNAVKDNATEGAQV